MKIVADPIDRALLDDWQRDFPICERPFEAIARQIGTTEADVLDRLSRMHKAARVTRVGATCAPNTASASTLAAVAAPRHRIDHVAAIIGAQEGVNHSYLREDDWNLWFVATGPDRTHVDATLATISVLTGLQVLDLRMVRPFNDDLGFRMTRTVPVAERKPPAARRVSQRSSSSPRTPSSSLWPLVSGASARWLPHTVPPRKATGAASGARVPVSLSASARTAAITAARPGSR